MPADESKREFGGARSTMRKLLENEYTQTDVEGEDEPIALKDPVFRARLEDLRANGASSYFLI